MMTDYISYTELLPAVGVQPGERLLFSADVLKLATSAQAQGENFSPRALLDSMKEYLDTQGTLIVPSYNWGFCKGEEFDIRNTMPETGMLSRAAVKHPDFVRTSHPLYSFAVWGRDAELLASMNNRSSFGSDSPFAYFHEKNVRMLIVGLDYQRSLTFVHYVEEQEGAPYRYLKDFTAEYRDAAGVCEERTYSMFVRKLELGVRANVNPLGSILEQRGVASRTLINGIPVMLLSLGDAYPIISEDLRENAGINLVRYQAVASQGE